MSERLVTVSHRLVTDIPNGRPSAHHGMLRCATISARDLYEPWPRFGVGHPATQISRRWRERGSRIQPCSDGCTQRRFKNASGNTKVTSEIGLYGEGNAGLTYMGRRAGLRKPPADDSAEEHPASAVLRWPEDAIFTLGHSTLPIELFIRTLETYGIERLVDIRTIPRSRHNPQFNEGALAGSLAGEHIEYAHVPALGGLRRPGKESPNTGWRNPGFRGYADYMQTKAFQDAIEDLIHMSLCKRIAIMCAEAVPWRCHRSLVADALSVRGLPVIEILSVNSYRMHKLTPFAEVQGTQITYPPEQSSLL
jgi:hypothetical protein